MERRVCCYNQSSTHCVINKQTVLTVRSINKIISMIKWKCLEVIVLDISSWNGWLVYDAWPCVPLSIKFQLYHGGQLHRGGQLYHGGHFHEWRKPEEATKLQQVTDKPYHILLYQVHFAMNVVGTHNFVCDKHWLHK